MVLLWLLVSDRDSPVDRLIVRGIALVGRASRFSLQKVIEFLFVQQHQANVGGLVISGIWIVTLGERPEVAMQSWIRLMGRNYEGKLGIFANRENSAHKILGFFRALMRRPIH